MAMYHMPPSEQRVESQRAQQQYIQRQQAEAVAMMQRDRIDIPNANWTPPWEYVPHPYASPEHQDRPHYMPAFMGHPDYSGMPKAGQPAAPMDSAMFADYHAQVDGTARVGEQPSNAFARETADEFYRAQETRGAPMTFGVPGQIPHYGYLAPPLDSDVEF